MTMQEFYRARHAEKMRQDRIRKDRRKELIKEIAVAMTIPGMLGWIVLIAMLGGAM